jgi:3alpha(or 20beta)-hydroxysteroid dehydrogenase
MADLSQLVGKVALITGGARGLGAAQARMFVERGAQVVIGDLLDEEGEKLAAALGSAAHYIHHDVTSEDEWNAAVGVARSRFGKLDTMVNNAGISPAPKNLTETSFEEYERVIRINQFGAFLSLRTCLPALLDAGGGSIILIASSVSMNAAAGLAPYASSKYAVRALARTAALEHARDGIRVNSVLPGPMDTEMNKPGYWFEGVDLRPRMAKTNPAGRCGDADEVAELVSFLSSDASSYCNGNEYHADGGQNAGTFVSPRSFAKDGK